MIRGEVKPTPVAPLPFRVFVWQGPDLIRAEPAHSRQEAQRLLVKLLEAARAD